MKPGMAARRRSLSGRVWRYRPADEQRISEIARAADVSDGLARLLAGRGIAPDQASAWLDADLRADPPDASGLVDLERAAEILANAVQRGERIGVLGDYDVDGLSSTAQLIRYLRGMDSLPAVHIPDRHTEGYGPTRAGIDRLRGAGAQVVVTVDCGTTAFEPLRYAAECGLRTIVVDHHATEAELPPAVALVNPHRSDDRSGLGALASSGLAWLLIRTLDGELRCRQHAKLASAPRPDSLLDLAALGTVCDLAPLVGVNRRLVRQGLAVLEEGGNPGLRAIAAIAGLEEAPQAWHFGFVYGPRINAAGRIGDAALALRILSTDDALEAGQVAKELERMNRQRQSLEAQVHDDALAQAAAMAEDGQPVLVVVGDGWHIGVIGIVASRLVNRFQRPAVVCSRDGNLLRGSARSLGDIDIGTPVIRARQAGLLVAGGGHRMAAGFTGTHERVRDLTRFLNAEVSGALPAGGIEAELLLDGVLAVSGANVELGTELERAGPFGAGNPRPCFAFRRVFPVHARVVGSGHVSCLLADETRGRVKAIAFRSEGTAAGNALLRGRPIDVAGQVQFSTWRGRERAEVHIQDVAESAA